LRKSVRGRGEGKQRGKRGEGGGSGRRGIPTLNGYALCRVLGVSGISR
jgi:hypothetical protein